MLNYLHAIVFINNLHLKYLPIVILKLIILVKTYIDVGSITHYYNLQQLIIISIFYAVKTLIIASYVQLERKDVKLNDVSLVVCVSHGKL